MTKAHDRMRVNSEAGTEGETTDEMPFYVQNRGSVVFYIPLNREILFLIRGRITQ